LAVSRQLLRRIVEATQGNPLFVLEVGRSLIELGTPSVADEIPLPDDGDAPEHGASAACLGAERLTREGTPVEFVRLIFIPEDETCFYIYRADSIEAVRAAAARSSLQFERVSEAVTEVGMPVRATRGIK
jgi:hypothetical protein